MRLVKTAFLLTSTLSFAHASTFGVAGNYNVFTFGNFSQSNTDSQGNVAVGGNATLSSFSVGALSGSASYPYSLVVGGTLTDQYGTNYGGIATGGNANLNGLSVNGNVSVNGTLTAQNGTINGSVAATTYNETGVVATGGQQGSPASIASVVNFAAAQSQLDNDSAYWGTLPQSGTVSSAYGQVTLTGSNAALNVFNLTSAQLAGATGGLIINAPANSTVLINITGSSASFPNTGYSVNGVSYQNVLFNFENATTLTGSGGLYGSILAPYAAFTFNNGQINGNVIVSSLSGSGETHDSLFQGTITGPPTVATPEPASILLLSGGIGLMLLGRRKKLN